MFPISNDEFIITDEIPAVAPPVDDQQQEEIVAEEKQQDEEQTTAEEVPANIAPKKRNCGKTGPTSSAGRKKSALNALKHGACAETLILPTDSPEGWEILLARWQDAYHPREDALEANFVLRTATAEWELIRTQRAYNDFLKSTCGKPLFTWPPEDIKMHELMLRYKNAAERSFHREYKALEAHYKSHKLAKAAPEPDADQQPPTSHKQFIVELGTDEEVRQIAEAERYNNPYPAPS